MKAILLASLIVFLSSVSSYGAVAYVTANTGIETGTDADVSLTIDVGAGADRLLLCAVAINGNTITVSGITHNSVGLTQSALGPVCSNYFCVDVWYLVNPSSGSQTVTATLSDVGVNKIISCMAFSGVNQSAPLDTGGSYASYDDPATATVTIPANGMGVAFGIANDQTTAGSFTVDANSTKRYDLADTDGNFAAVGSTTVTAGTNAQTISNPNIDYFAMIVFPINQAVAASTSRRQVVVVQ